MLEFAKQETPSEGTHSPVTNAVRDGLTHLKVLEFGGYDGEREIVGLQVEGII